MINIKRYVNEAGKDVVGSWLSKLKDIKARAVVNARIARLAVGNFGDSKSLHDGVRELKISYGPGYRVYYSMVDRQIVLLLCGGDKKTQSDDIKKAVNYLKEYKRRSK